jgi:hypothetical protein
MSLHKTLNNLIRERGYVSYEEIVRITLEEGYKPSNAERRLRQSESPLVIPVMAKSRRGTDYIKGYKWKQGIDYTKDNIYDAIGRPDLKPTPSAVNAIIN